LEINQGCYFAIAYVISPIVLLLILFYYCVRRNT